jgi:predicted small metal-binding protein
MPSDRRPNGPRARCRDLGEYPDCLFLIAGDDDQMFFDRLRAHLRDAHGVTPVGYARRRRVAEARVDRLSPRPKEY